MNTKITLPKLISHLAVRTGESKRLCEDFIKSLFATIADTLVAGESVKVKGLGVFKLVRVDERKSVNVATGGEYIIPAHDKLTFVPAKELASAVNAPFEIFEAVELSETMTDEQLELAAAEIPAPVASAPKPEDFEPEELEQPEPQQEEAPESQQEEAPESVCYKLEEDEEILLNRDEAEAESREQQPAQEPEKTALSQEETESPEVDAAAAAPMRRRERTRRSFGRGFFIGFCSSLVLILIAMGIGYTILYDNAFDFVKEKNDVRTDTIALYERKLPATQSDTVALAPVADAAGAVPTQPSDAAPAKEKVYDTVTTTRYLTTIAQEYYGDMQFWPYIYEKNKAILGHPNKIKPGTRVEVPDLGEYGVNPKSKEDRKTAIAKGAAIYARFKN